MRWFVTLWFLAACSADATEHYAIALSVCGDGDGCEAASDGPRSCAWAGADFDGVLSVTDDGGRITGEAFLFECGNLDEVYLGFVADVEGFVANDLRWALRIRPVQDIGCPGEAPDTDCTTALPGWNVDDLRLRTTDWTGGGSLDNGDAVEAAWEPLDE